MSVSTVSKSLNDDPSISTLTKERVKKLANDWNYIPNEAARHFKLSKTFTLGLIIPDMMDQFYALAINGAEKVAAEEQNVGEEDRGQQRQERDVPPVALPLGHPIPVILNAIGMITNSWIASNTPCATIPGRTFFVR